MERGDFIWKGDKLEWEPSEKGEIVIHPVLGPMLFDSPLKDYIIGKGLAEDIDKALKDKIKNL